jgi:hypothetical protein
MTTALAKPVRFPVTEDEARQRFEQRKKEAQGLSYAWFDFCFSLRKDFSDRVPERLSLSAKQYVEQIIPHERSRADIYMTIRIAEKLPNVPPEDLKEIGRLNAYRLTMLPKVTKEWVARAKSMGELKFQEAIEADRAQREGALYERTVFIAEAFRLNKLPKTLADKVTATIRHICNTEDWDYEQRQSRLDALEALLGEYDSSHAPEGE